MAVLGQRFNAQDHNTEQRDFEELPSGIYVMEIEASDVGKTANQSGTILKTTCVVLEPEGQKNRKLFNNFNIENANPTAQKIGQEQFAALCRAIGLDSVEDSEELHFKSFTVKVGLGKPSKPNAQGVSEYPARAEIKRYYFPDEGQVPVAAIDAVQPRVAANDNRPAAANDNRPAQAQAATANGKKNPWSK